MSCQAAPGIAHASRTTPPRELGGVRRLGPLWRAWKRRYEAAPEHSASRAWPPPSNPTGSGKTTTLYAALQGLNRADVKIITAEEPVEYHLTGINQCQVRRRIGLTFSR